MESWSKNPFVWTAVAAVAISLLALYGTLKWLEVYTLHNDAVAIPDVKGLKPAAAAEFFQNARLRYSVIDSVFSNDVPPGAIVELVPSAGSKVKRGRIVFVTINAVTSQTATVPDVEDLSSRQAYALLKSKGFTDVEVEYIPGRYKDLAVSVEWAGRTLRSGERIALAAPLVLKVSQGDEDPDSYLEGDSIELVPTNDEENWF